MIAKVTCIYYVPGTEVTAVIVCVHVSIIIVNPQDSMVDMIYYYSYFT